jgi:transposase
MNKNIINKYVKLLLIIINNVDPIDKCIGRPIIYSYKYCLKIIFDMLYTGISWRLMEKLLKIRIDAVRKRFNKWISLEVFNKAYNSLFKLY